MPLMDDETPYRWAVLAIMAGAMSIAAYHRLQAAKSRERISRKEEGLVFAIVLRLAGLGLWLATFAYLIEPRWIAWAALPLPAALRWSGAVVGAISCGLMFWTLTNLGKNLTDTVVTRAGAYLVTSGPYRWVRHPFYVTAALLMTSVTLLSANTLIGACSLVILTMLAIRTPKEEQNLIERFGDEYRNYIDKTGRFVPRLGGRS